MTEKIVVGIDVAKSSMDVAIQKPGRTTYLQKQFQNTNKGINKLIEVIEKEKESQNMTTIHVCLEATGRYSRSITTMLLNTTQYKISEVNPAKISAFGKTLLLRTKTDRVDARLICEYAQKMDPIASQKIPKWKVELKEYTRFLANLIKERSSLKGYLDAMDIPDIKKTVSAQIRAYDRHIIKVESKIKSIVDSEPKLKKECQLLKSIIGVGQKLAVTALSELIEETKSTRSTVAYSKRKQTAHAGLAPSKRQSGTSVNGRPKICKTGSGILRKALYMPTLSAIRFNPIISAFYHRLVSKGKPKMVAVVACMRKLLALMIGVLNSQKPFSKEWVSKPYYVT